jgi:hypothetical protein
LLSKRFNIKRKGVIEMKKIITSMCLILLVGLFVYSIADAGEPFCGIATINAITLHRSCGCDDTTSSAVAGFENNAGPASFSYLCTSDVPIAPCKVALTFPFPNGETAEISATACGTQINLALLKAFNESEPVYICLYMAWDPLHGNTVSYVIKDVSFPAVPVFPVNTIGDAAALR